jgi:iron complex outermembrane receptor protein
MNTHKWPRATLALASALAALGGPIWAQQVPASAGETATPSEEETIILSPFEVSTSKDKGYKATNATSGTRLNTPIKDVPINLEVITNDFMRDTGATNLREGLRYSAGIVLESQSDAFAEDDANPQSAGANDPRGVTRQAGDSTIKLRGFVISQVLRDGFRRQYSADWINISRTEVVRGPSALLYGVGSFGGVVNFMPKRPEHKEAYYGGVTVGTDNFYRAEFDATGPLYANGTWAEGLKPAYRLTGAYQEREDYSDYYSEEHWVLSPSFTIQPFKNTTVFFDNEFGNQKQKGVGFQNIRNNVGGEGATPGRQATWLTDVFDLTGKKISERVDNRTFRWSGPDTYQKGPFRNNIIDVTQKIGDDLFFKVGFAQSEATFDTRQVSNAGVKRGGPIGVPASRQAALYGTVQDNPYSQQAINGAPTLYTDGVLAYQWKDYDKAELRDQVRAELTYTHDLGKWGKHTVLAGVQYMGLKSEEKEYGPAYSYSNLWGGSNAVDLYNRYSYKNPTDYTPFRYGVQGDGVPDNPRIHLYNYTKKTWDVGHYAVYQGQFFDGRLTLIGGVRRDRTDARKSTHYIYEQRHPDDVQGLGALGTTGSKVPTATSPQVGASFAITRNLSVFGVYSTGVVPNYYDYDGYGNMLEPTEAKNYEAGVKFDFADGRISGTISAYKIERENQPKFIWWAPSVYESLKKGWDPSSPTSTVAWYAMPSTLWQAINTTQGKTPAQGLALAKQIYPAAWHPLLDEIATSTTADGAWGGPIAGNFWNFAGQAEANTNSLTYTGDQYFPLLDLGNADVAAFWGTVAALPGWNGNYFHTAGHPYRYGNGTTGFGNAANGSGASVKMDDESKGWDMSVILRPVDELEILFNFAHVDRKITTSTYRFISAPYFPWAPWYTSDNNYGTLDNTVSAAAVYANVQDTSTYQQLVPDYNQPADDTPRNQASIWVHYSMDKLGSAFKGWGVGLGGQWEDNRLWFSGFSGGGSNFTLVSGTRELLKLYTKERYTFNAMLEYSTKISNRYDFRVALNVDNVLDDKDLYGLVYAQGLTAKINASIRF